jgi:SAM-dependent methyltransferase
MDNAIAREANDSTFQWDENPDFPLPPEDLVYRVTGGRDMDWFRRSGQMSVKDIEVAVSKVGRKLTDFRRVLDFGCGCGRILSWMQRSVPSHKLCGVDIDREAIEWLQPNLPDIDLRATDPLPPLPFQDHEFDLVYCHSVFTHLDEHYQDSWLEELRRVTCPGGILVLTFSGEHAFQSLEETWRSVQADPEPMRKTLESRGTLFIEDDEWKNGPFPDFYHSMFHTLSYVKKHWGKYFQMKGHIPTGSLGFQDFAVFERVTNPVADANDSPEPSQLVDQVADTAHKPNSNEPAIALPPIDLRVLVGPTEDEFFDNPSGQPILPEVPPTCYESVFDFGCGCGRLARQLLQQHSRPRRYLGIDIQQKLIDWCSNNLTPHDPNFAFLHHDVFNLGLAPSNTRRSTAPFPCTESSFSLVLAHSIFTHLVQDQTEYYLREVARILTPGGIAYTTWFFFDRGGFPWLQDHQVCLFVNAIDPTNAVIYDRGWFLSAVRAAGLTVRRSVPASVPGHQWQVYLVRREKDSIDNFPLGAEGGDKVCGAAPYRAIPSPSTVGPQHQHVENENRELKLLVAELSLELRRRRQSGLKSPSMPE